MARRHAGRAVAATLAVAAAWQLASVAFVAPLSLSGLSQGRSALLVPEQVPRGEEPRTTMYARALGENKKKTKTKLCTKYRKPVYSYSLADIRPGATLSVADAIENPTSVIRRLREMTDLDHVIMAQQRQEYYKVPIRASRWRANFNMRLGRKYRLRREKQQYDIEWAQWLRTEGRKRGITEAVVYAGPPLKHLLTPELDAATEPSVFKKKLPTKEEMRADHDLRKRTQMTASKRALMIKEIQPGMWYAKDDPENPHNLFKRPLHKHVFDIGKKGKNPGPVCRGQVY